MKKKLFTEEEEGKIFSAASSTWCYVAHDAREIGVCDIGGAIEMVVDAGRILDIGKLDKAIYERLVAMDYKKIESFLKKNRDKWY